MPTTDRVPAVSQELVTWLEHIFPDRCPSPEDPEREIWMAAGAARVVRLLRMTHEQQFNSVVGG